MKTKNYSNLIKSVLLCAIFCVGKLIPADAQVTIGSDLEPNGGALLDLKQENKEVSSTKGLMLPRVYLVDLKKLDPMYDYDKSAPSASDLLEHTGLTVYNVNETEDDDAICPSGIRSGVYVWDMEKWIPLHHKEALHSDRSDDTSVLVDKRNSAQPETYKIARFNDAGWWMIENLRADRMPDGTPIRRGFVANGFTDYESVYNYPKALSNSTAVVDDSNPSVDVVTRNPEYGYIYSWKAATNGKDHTIDDAINYEGVQGICPDGWHLPSRLEWLELFNEVEQDLCEFSSTPLLEYDNAMLRARVAIVVDKSKGVENIPNIPLGSSRSYEEGGFNFLPTGICNGNGRYYQYGNYARAWTSSSKGYVVDGYHAWMATINVESIESYQGHEHVTHWYASAMLPVRCKKNAD